MVWAVFEATAGVLCYLLMAETNQLRRRVAEVDTTRRPAADAERPWRAGGGIWDAAGGGLLVAVAATGASRQDMSPTRRYRRLISRSTATKLRAMISDRLVELAGRLLRVVPVRQLQRPPAKNETGVTPSATPITLFMAQDAEDDYT